MRLAEEIDAMAEQLKEFEIEGRRYLTRDAAALLEKLKAALASNERDAERWRQLLMRITAESDNRGHQHFVYPALDHSAFDLMRGSVAEHFSNAIDRLDTARAGGEG